jgi:hypothetical protein
MGIAGWFDTMTESATFEQAKGAKSLIILVCSSIWQERNSRIFEGQEKQSSRVVTEIWDETKLWVQAGAKHLSLLVIPPTSE